MSPLQANHEQLAAERQGELGRSCGSHAPKAGCSDGTAPKASRGLATSSAFHPNLFELQPLDLQDLLVNTWSKAWRKVQHWPHNDVLADFPPDYKWQRCGANPESWEAWIVRIGSWTQLLGHSPYLIQLVRPVIYWGMWLTYFHPNATEKQNSDLLNSVLKQVGREGFDFLNTCMRQYGMKIVKISRIQAEGAASFPSVAEHLVAMPPPPRPSRGPLRDVRFSAHTASTSVPHGTEFPVHRELQNQSDQFFRETPLSPPAPGQGS